MIEVVLMNGRIVRVEETIDADAIARLILVLDAAHAFGKTILLAPPETEVARADRTRWRTA